MISIYTKTWSNSHQSAWPDIKGCQNIIVIKRRVHKGFGSNQRLRVCGKRAFFTERKLEKFLYVTSLLTNVEIIRSNVVVPEEGRTFQRSADVSVMEIDFKKEDERKF